MNELMKYEGVCKTAYTRSVHYPISPLSFTAPQFGVLFHEQASSYAAPLLIFLSLGASTGRFCYVLFSLAFPRDNLRNHVIEILMNFKEKEEEKFTWLILSIFFRLVLEGGGHIFVLLF